MHKTRKHRNPPAVDAYPIDAGVVSAYANSGTSTCKLQISPSSDPATVDWIEIDDLGSFTGNGTLTSDPVDLIGQQARLLITAGGTATFQVAATALLRG